jgi:hypothetical protein
VADAWLPTGAAADYLALSSSLASFFYEIGWIRMLSLVLGSSTQAFELMLSAFILGLALGRTCGFGGGWTGSAPRCAMRVTRRC